MKKSKVKPIQIRLVMTVVGGHVTRDFYVHDDRRPGGYDRMVDDALTQASKCPDFPRGCTLSVKSNWTKP